MISAGEQLHYLLVSLHPSAALPMDTWISYTIELQPEGMSDWLSHEHWAPDLCYPGASSPAFRIASHAHSVLHGSCRKPHFPGPDGLAAADALLQRILAADEDDTDMPEWPAVLVMSGDQIYTDDVAGPMLSAIHALVAQLGLPREQLRSLEVGDIEDSAAL